MIKRISLLIFLINFDVLASPLQEEVVNIYCFRTSALQDLNHCITYLGQKYAPNPVKIITHYAINDDSFITDHYIDLIKESK